jgi:methyltransferase (TIGR00027 family)
MSRKRKGSTMETAQRSRTAEAVAAARAEHFLYDRPLVFADPFAIHLTSAAWRIICKNRVLHWLVATKFLGALRPVRAQFLARSRYAEELLEQAVAHGVAQYVLLGAGLDSFALRRPDLAIKVFELDHPASQASKRARLSRRGLAVPAHLEFVAIDFEQETVADALARSSFRRERPAFFSWLGTTQYLTRDAVRDTLQSLAVCAAPASELVLTYQIPLARVEPRDRATVEKVMRFAARRGEPFLSFFDPDAFSQELSTLGFELIENLSPQEQRARYFATRTDELRPLSSMYCAHCRVRR